MSSRNVLGKGLGSLLPQVDNGKFDNEAGPYFICPLNDIQPNHYQPRKQMDDTALQQLANSISEKGILQPLVVREKDDGNGYELIAGERRWRAAQIAGLDDVPVLVKEASKEDRLELALIENIQRQNLNPLEEAEAYQRLLDEFSLKQEEVAKRVGKERSTVANTLRILQLPDFAKQDVAAGSLTMGHARALLSLDSSEEMKFLRDEIVAKGLSVRQVEKLAKSMKGKKQHSSVSPSNDTNKKVDEGLPDSYCKALTNDLVSHLGTKARIVQNGARGKIEIEYYSFDDLERLLALVVNK